ncbi:MAG TPA: ABC transporter ATP-binding protein [Desulfobacteraceae bacterium]|nr:ABC transporter ATP-binding protein [Deltaproteobacteria bacterium]HDI59463.1 ABC transporter ATP-binding protein [Desulfobacteraceae bacterium]
MPLIDIRHLTHRFADGTLALDDIDLAVEAGAFVLIAGANGSGKTTLLRHLNGLLRPTAGSVHIDGVPVTRDPQRARRRVGLVFQDVDTQIVGETVADDAAFGPENLGLPRPDIEARVTAALEAMDLAAAADMPPHLLSGGQKRRLAIAGVLAMDPAVIAFDEPFSNLDYPGVRSVLRRMIDLRAAGKTLIVTTHDLDKVAAHADRLLVLAHGRLVLDGPPGACMDDIERYGIRQPCSYRFGGRLESWLN